jgi:hypothetical protein
MFLSERTFFYVAVGISLALLIALAIGLGLELKWTLLRQLFAATPGSAKKHSGLCKREPGAFW